MGKRWMAFGAAIFAAALGFAAGRGDFSFRDNAALYAAAVRDSVFAEEGEILPLVALTPSDPLTAWDSAGRVLLLTFHRYPESYPAGQGFTASHGEVWTVSAPELAAWYRSHGAGVSDWPLRFKQLLGCHESKPYSHFSALWVKPSDVRRPAYEPDPARQLTAARLSADAPEDFKAWWNANIVRSYFGEGVAVPWTRLGYTYDWAAGGKEYGLTEFIIRAGAQGQVEFTLPTADFLKRL